MTKPVVVVIGIDPGLSAGIVELVNGELNDYLQGAAQDAEDFLERLLKQYAEYHPAWTVTVACERYVQAGRGRVISHQPEAQKMIGVVERLCTTYGVPLELQMPADAHRIASDAFLRQTGMLVMPTEVGQQDADDVRMATRHAVLTLARRHATVFSALMDRRSAV